MRPCRGCERGAPFDGPYDITRQCRFCWLYHNDGKAKEAIGYKSYYDNDNQSGIWEPLPIPPPPTEPPRIEPPSLTKMLSTFVSANITEASHRLGGGSGPTTEEKAKRRSICDSCEARDKDGDSCMICGCSLEARLLPPIPLGKLDMATQRCPLGKWEAAISVPKPAPCGGCGGQK